MENDTTSVQQNTLQMSDFQNLLLSEMKTVEKVGAALEDIEEILFDPDVMNTMTNDELLRLHRAAISRKNASQNFMLRFLDLVTKTELEKAWLREAEVVAAHPSKCLSPKAEDLKNQILAEIRNKTQL